MIISYEVKTKNNEEILILHLEYLEEFGKDMNRKNENKSLKQEINEFIKNKSIKWNGNKIILMCGGISLGLLIITNSQTNQQDSYKYIDKSILLAKKTIEIQKEENIIQEPQKNKEINTSEIITEEIKETTNTIPPKENNNTSTTKEEINNNEKNKTNQQNNKTQEIENKEEQKTATIEETKQEEIKNTKQQITITRTNGTIVTMNITDYLIGVVGAEMPAAFQIEALKAQSVVARTYALKRIEEGKTLTDSVTTQSYKDNNELKSMWGSSYDTYYQKIKQAVEETKNMTIKYQGQYIDAVYHSTSNGKTEDSKEVWGNEVPYLKSVDSTWDINSTPYLKTIEKDINAIWTILGIDLEYDKVQVLTRNESNRVTSVQIGNKSYSGVEFRNLLGLRSADFDIIKDNQNLIITTRGYGHGVGMSQYGANEMAKKGYNYQQIINHYYTNVTITD